jgi:3-phosphoshikimate 1-carboxyvinyltransferase
MNGNGNLRAIEADMTNMPDTAQTLAVVASCAQGITTLRGLSTLRVKETDRIAALQTELGKLGIKTESGPDYLVVHGGSLKPARISTYEDHRMAMSFAVLAGKISCIEIENENVVEKSFPNFWQIFKELRISCTNFNS